jgi:hypothetical protein
VESQKLFAGFYQARNITRAHAHGITKCVAVLIYVRGCEAACGNGELGEKKEEALTAA